MLDLLRRWIRQYGLMAIFVWAFLGAGLGLLGWGVWGSLQAANSRLWPTVQGTITRADISTSTSDSDTMYVAEIRYVYTVAGQELRGNQVTFGDYSSSNPRHAEDVVERYPVGSTVKIFYNPRNPLESVLEPGFAGGLLLPLGLGAAFTLVGGVMAFGMLRWLFSGEGLNGE